MDLMVPFTFPESGWLLTFCYAKCQGKSKKSICGDFASKNFPSKAWSESGHWMQEPARSSSPCRSASPPARRDSLRKAPYNAQDLFCTLQIESESASEWLYGPCHQIEVTGPSGGRWTTALHGCIPA
eukprot:1351661-Amphidinium_carterae.1